MAGLDAEILKRIVDESCIGLWVVEFEEGQPPRFYANGIMDMLLGIPAEVTPEVRFALHHGYIHPDDLSLFEEYSDQLSTKRTEVIYRYVHPEIGERYVRCGGMRDFSEKRFVKFFGTHQDISDIIRLEGDNSTEARLTRVIAEKEEALIRAQKASRAKSEFLSRMSHDIRTPLNGIIGIMEINERHSDDLELVAANRAKGKVAAQHLLALINDVLDMSKLEDDSLELTREPMNLMEEFASVLTIINLKAKERAVTVEHDGGKAILFPNVFGSRLRLRQLMMNVLGNGIKYNKLGGKIYGSTELISSTNEQVVYCFTIEDTGIGMSQEFIEHIFEPFSQEKSDARSRYQGSGLGMAIVKKLAEKMGGDITVESTLGVGTKFHITLPFEINYYSDAEKEESRADEIMLQGRTILLAEDNELNADIVRYILEDLGVNVVVARNGLEAVRLFESNPAGTYDAILMDIMMPGLDGYGATEYIRKSFKADADTIPIIALSANAFAEDVQRSKSYGMNDHLAKPLDTKLLIKTLGHFLT